MRELLFLDSLVVIASPRHPLAGRRRVDPEALHQYRWILPGEDSTFYQQLSQTLRQAGYPTPFGMVQSYSMHAIPAVVANSDLLGFLPASLYAAGTFGGTLRPVPVSVNWLPAPVGVLMRPATASEERMQPFLRTLRAVVASARVAGAGG